MGLVSHFSIFFFNKMNHHLPEFLVRGLAGKQDIRKLKELAGDDQRPPLALQPSRKLALTLLIALCFSSFNTKKFEPKATQDLETFHSIMLQALVLENGEE
jgi:hypothetical protein